MVEGTARIGKTKRNIDRSVYPHAMQVEGHGMAWGGIAVSATPPNNHDYYKIMSR